MSEYLTPDELTALRKLALSLLPTSEKYPTLDEADPDGDVLERSLAEMQPHLPLVRELLDELAQAIATSDEPSDSVDADAFLDGLRTGDPGRYEILRFIVVGWYLGCRPVWKVIGYPGRNPRPIQSGEVELFLEGDLLGPPSRLGPVYRPTPVPDTADTANTA